MILFSFLEYVSRFLEQYFIVYERVIESISLSLSFYILLSRRERKKIFVGNFHRELKQNSHRLNDTTLDNTRRQRSFLIPLFLVYEEKGIWEKRVSATFVDSTASESVSRAKVHIVSACLSPSPEREREREREKKKKEKGKK